ncbi:hypothetical protein K2X14_01700 [Acetobacter sp. TBRC 12305]|uniref:Uncharacterized protein n=1 Tax=Acetobacter garciniae TaxID=2817435 RepID=A0A939HI65_9PROT|nr:hypothetical protein [Acetobacter garciniae]MBO1323867.1 hypothetical protein [Acetobacter garciniae]MBX0343556.1 hypothetical protein [Acetobacter garciniae]
MTFRLFCVLAVFACLGLDFIAPHYHGTAEIGGLAFLGFAVAATVLGLRADTRAKAPLR